MAIKTINTDKPTLEAYIKAGKWELLGEVKWHRAHAGFVQAKVEMKGGYKKEVTLIIAGYFKMAQ